ncbi:hypothetical protein LTR66_014851 [Elasticomyces elasticus]|nr:hypothetical protein LTR66_014851 [Elasticomyces elasticus]KAK5008305.1 hypothetical protein LTR28_004164 [Elasticomyces elasticus]
MELVQDNSTDGYEKKSGRSAPVVPNFFTEGKGPKGRTDVAKRQACYDGAIGARAMLHARSYANGGAMVYDGNAYTITSTYHDGVLRMYTTHHTEQERSQR